MTNEGKAAQALKSKDSLITVRQSDQPVVPMKEGNASGGKGLTVKPDVSGKHRPHTEGGRSMGTRLGRLTDSTGCFAEEPDMGKPYVRFREGHEIHM